MAIFNSYVSHYQRVNNPSSSSTNSRRSRPTGTSTPPRRPLKKCARRIPIGSRRWIPIPTSSLSRTKIKGARELASGSSRTSTASTTDTDRKKTSRNFMTLLDISSGFVVSHHFLPSQPWGQERSAALSHLARHVAKNLSCFHNWRYPNGWMGCFMENPKQKWMIWGTPMT